MAITITTANAQIKQKPRYLVKDLYIADPSAHLFNGKIYVYPSHDIEAGIPE
ncbi:MAG: alpha-N-arabinofuranosidase, partial [Bacteroidota bacterium]